MESIFPSTRIDMTMNRILFLISLMTALTGTAHAKDSFGGRVNLNLGGWSSRFEQSQGDQKSKVSTLLGPAVGIDLGIGLKWFFIEYSANWHIPAYSAGPKARDASYYSLLGLNLGISPPVIPVEIYGGVEDGNYGLSGGANPDYDGVTLKAGASIAFIRTPVAAISVKAEYRRFFAMKDDAGDIPDGIKTRADLFFVGLAMSLR